jgi:xanthine/uracil permease
MKGLRNGISIFLSSGYCVGTVVAMILSAILPEDVGVNMGRDGDSQEIEKSKDKLEDNTKLAQIKI